MRLRNFCLFTFSVFHFVLCFSDLASLKEHFRKNHYLCEEGNCANETFTNVFKNEIDFKGKMLI